MSDAHIRPEMREPDLATVQGLPAAKRPRRQSEKSFVPCQQTPAVPRKPDGRPCHTCGCKDDSDDPVDKALQNIDPHSGKIMVRFWGYKPLPDGRTQGNHCGYCCRAFTGRYACRKQNPKDPASRTHTP